MNPAKVLTEFQEHSKKCIAELNKYKSDFERAVSDFLTFNQKNCLLIETRDSKLGAIRIMHLLKLMEEGQINEKALGRYLGAENQTFLHWKQLLDTVETATDLPSFTNLLVCIFPDGESRKIENTEEEVFRKISDRLTIAVLKKVIFITSHKGKLNQHLKEIDTKMFLKIDEFEYKVTSVIGDGRTALQDKASRGDVKGLEELLKNGIDVNVTFGEDKLTALHIAAKQGHTNLVSTLLKNGADILSNKYGDTPLHTAVSEGHTDVVRVLLENDVDVEIGGKMDQTALFQAAKIGHTEVTKILLQHNANINNGHSNKGTSGKPLYTAVINGHQDIVLMLLENGADVDIEGMCKETPLHYAAKTDQADIVKILLEHGANVNARNVEKEIPLHRAAKGAQIEIINTLLNYGADINAIRFDQWTPLFFAVWYRQFDIVKVLIERGANVHLTNQLGRTPLDLALKRGYHEIVFLLKTISASIH